MNTSPASKNDAPKEPKSLGDAALDLLSDAAPAPSAPPVARAAVETSLELPANAPPFAAKLEAAVKGLEMPSESDAPFRVVYWPLEKTELTPSEVAFYAAERADAPVETRSVEAFFKDAAKVEDWMKDDDRATAKRFGDLIETLNDELGKPRVYLIGKRERTAAVIGKVEGGFGGVVTLVVET